MADSGPSSSYACKCLNVRIHGVPPPPPPREPLDSSFVPVFAAEQGVSITHTQLTLRHKGPRTERKVGGKTETVRTVTLTCLICDTLVYRVSQVISPDVESGEGLVLPTDDWVEKEVLRSADGWIEVSKDILSGKSVEAAEASPQYSKTFGIVLPTNELPTTTEGHAFLTPPQTARPNSPTLPENILPHLPELFPPPPFTPTHPVFVHLSSFAIAESEKLRASTEEYLKSVLQEKIAEVQAIEAKLKQDVDQLWANFRSVVRKLEDGDASALPPRLKTRRSSSRGRGPVASVRVTDFVPTSSPPPRQMSRPSAHLPSALSASLATSTLQDAMQHRLRNPSPKASSASPTRTAQTDSSPAASSGTLGIPINGEAENREAHRRNMDERVDYATSYRYLMDLESQMEANRIPEPVQEEDEDQNEDPSPSPTAVPRGRSPRAGKSAIKKPKANGDVDAVKEAGSPERNEPDKSPAKEATTPTKGKRKVTFDVKPDVAIIATSSSKHSSKTDIPEAEVFDMEGETLDGDVDSSGSVNVASQPEVPIQEPIRLARRPDRLRHASNHGLPASLSSLRPASLPLPSTMRRVVALDTIDERARAQSTRVAVLSPTAEADAKRRDVEEARELKEDEEQVIDPREAEILRLVAASMPSHRSAWKRDSSTWRTFVDRQKSQDRVIPEEDESSAAEGSAYYDESTDSSGPDEEMRVDGTTVIPKSLPIPIGPLGVVRKNVAHSNNQDKVSAAAMRRASYAERDRMRMVDPGPLDFDVEDDDDEESSNSTANDTQVGGKSMQLALNILQKYDEIPGADMWRSLA